jgi:hypothetical protein
LDWRWVFNMEGFPARDLALSYDKGNLVPFLGSGMSVPACAKWGPMVESLEAAAQIAASHGADLAARAERAVQILERQERFVHALKQAVYVDPDADLQSTDALVDLPWPLVVTTNYDSLFLDRYNRKHGNQPPAGYYRMEVVGRDRGHCQRVLNSARTPDSPLLWAVQGFFGSHASDDIHLLCDQLTVGHTYYSRQTQTATNFRRAFAEIYRSKTLLFLGSGMSETYFHNPEDHRQLGPG